MKLNEIKVGTEYAHATRRGEPDSRVRRCVVEEIGKFCVRYFDGWHYSTKEMRKTAVRVRFLDREGNEVSLGEDSLPAGVFSLASGEAGYVVLPQHLQMEWDEYERQLSEAREVREAVESRLSALRALVPVGVDATLTASSPTSPVRVRLQAEVSEAALRRLFEVLGSDSGTFAEPVREDEGSASSIPAV